MAAVLTLVNFEVTDDGDETYLNLTVKGAVKTIPNGIEHSKGPKGTRVLKVSAFNEANVEAVSAVIALPKKIEIDGQPIDLDGSYDEGTDSDYYLWFAEGVPSDRGGKGEAIGEAPEEAPEAPEEPAAEAAPAPEAPAPAPYVAELKTVKSAKAFIAGTDDADVLAELKSTEEGGKNRKSILAAIDARVDELTAEPEPVEEEPEPVEEVEVEEAEEEAAPSREDFLTGLKVAELKAIAKGYTEAGFECKPGRSKATAIAAILATEAVLFVDGDELQSVAAGSVKDIKAHLTAIDDAGYLRRLRYHETQGKARKSVLKAIDDMITAIETEDAEPVVPEPTKPKRQAPPKGKAKGETKAKGRKKPEMSQDEKDARSTVAAQKEAMRKAFLLLKSGRKLRLLMSELIATVEEEETGIVSQPTGAKRPLYHTPGRIWKATKHHRNAEWGSCEYHAKCLEDGGYEIVHFAGARKDVKVGMTFPNANAMLRLLTGRDYPRVQVYRYFQSYDDPKGKK